MIKVISACDGKYEKSWWGSKIVHGECGFEEWDDKKKGYPRAYGDLWCYDSNHKVKKWTLNKL